MHAVIENSDSGFFQYWDRLVANDPVQNPIYMQQRADSLKIKDSAAQFTDRSFLVMAAEEPVFGCSLTLHLDEQGRKCIGYFGREASSHINQSSTRSCAIAAGAHRSAHRRDSTLLYIIFGSGVLWSDVSHNTGAAQSRWQVGSAAIAAYRYFYPRARALSQYVQELSWHG